MTQSSNSFDHWVERQLGNIQEALAYLEAFLTKDASDSGEMHRKLVAHALQRIGAAYGVFLEPRPVQPSKIRQVKKAAYSKMPATAQKQRWRDEVVAKIFANGEYDANIAYQEGVSRDKATIKRWHKEMLARRGHCGSVDDRC